MNRSFIPAVEPPDQLGAPAWWFAFQGEKLLVFEEGEAARVPFQPDLESWSLTPVRQQYLGALSGTPCFAVEIAADAVLPEGYTALGLRGLYGRLPEDLFGTAGRAAQVLGWDRTHRYCGQCGTPTASVPGERARKCPACGLTNYPRLSPAVIVLVSRGAELLLVRGHSFPEHFFSLVAGFVEPGESLEEAVAREVEEEVGLHIAEIRYFGSQPWPYPHQIMLGFTAVWASGELRVDPGELAEGGWFTRHNLPRMPPRMSIARKLIDTYLGDWAPSA